MNLESKIRKTGHVGYGRSHESLNASKMLDSQPLRKTASLGCHFEFEVTGSMTSEPHIPSPSESVSN